MAREHWQTETFALFNKGRAKITQAEWVESDYGPQMQFTLEISEVSDPPDFPFDTTQAWYSVGDPSKKGWRVMDNGARIVGATEGQKFSTNSKYGRLLNAVSDLGIDALLEEDPHFAGIWVGWEFEWERKEMQIIGLKGREGEKRDVDTSVLVPVAVVGGVSTRAVGISDETAKILAEVLNGKSLGAGRIAIMRDARLNSDDNLMELVANSFDQVVQELVSRGLLRAEGSLVQRVTGS